MGITFNQGVDILGKKCLISQNLPVDITGTCFIQKIYAPYSSLLQDKYLPFSPSPLRFNIFRLFVIRSLTQLYRYTPEIFLFSTATFKYIPTGRRSEMPDTILEGDHPKIISATFGWDWLSSFRREEFFKIFFYFL